MKSNEEVNEVNEEPLKSIVNRNEEPTKRNENYQNNIIESK